MKVETLKVNYIIDEKLSVKPTKMIVEQLDQDEKQNIHFEVHFNNRHFQSKPSDSTEYAIKYLQRKLPDNINIACCQSCGHGNFNPFGDMENEVFCLKDKTPSNKADVVEIFSNQDKTFKTRSRKLLDFCKDYQTISHNEKYTYNDWDLD
ncbi:hypothetical protein [Fredinandcohnia quinoae]|uniref:Uncharacterized protein n=1 Tax=Fredinandcohnia quinoae TaxID=2918902 RepID=A0AAW5E3K6_9BACI|nr:hypothetical protein [Fredinandcohnia sp. SECRCQ15]MCH1627511.1 hypothetical protein [Fredinandcohnia sp. SECRCQ15]